MNVYEYKLVSHPGGDGEGETSVFAEGQVLALNERHAFIKIGAEVGDKLPSDLSKITVSLRRFRDDSGSY